MNATLENNPQGLLPDIRQKYGLKRLVFVNSATHGYSEFELDKHMALFGDNNRGKTASLAALKLALFPETSFTRCREKFKFAGKDSDYSKEDSYKFYFPSRQSYIVTEIENPDGVFCMILYKDKQEWTYGRHWVHHPYDDVRHLFWDITANKGDGDFAKNLSENAIRASLRAMGCITTTETKDIAQYLFSGHRGDPSQSRFCLFPLSDGASKEAIEAFRNLYQLAFDIGQTDKRSLPRAIATIIEMRRGRKEERLSANLDDIMEAYDQLSARRNKLKTLENCLPAWKTLSDDYQSYRSLANALAIDLRDTKHHLESEVEAIEEKSNSITPRLEAAIDKQEQSRIEAENARDQWMKDSTLLEKTRNMASKHGERYKKAAAIQSRYGSGMTTREIITILIESRDDMESKIKALKDEESMKERMTSVIWERNQLIQNDKRLLALISENRPGMLDRLPTEVADALYTIQPSFGELPEEVAADAVESAAQFAEHISTTEQSTLFAGHLLPGLHLKVYDRALLREQWRAEVSKIKSEIASCDKEIGILDTALKNSAHKDQSLKKYRREIDETNLEINLLDGMNANKREYDELTEEANDLVATLESLYDAKENKEKAHAESRSQVRALNLEKSALAPRVSEIAGWLTRLDRLIETTPTHPELDELPVKDVTVTEISIYDLEKRFDSMNSARQRVLIELKDIKIAAFPGDDDAFNTVIEESELKQSIDDISVVFTELPYHIAQHESAVAAHNNTVDQQVQELREAKSTVEKFVTSLNEQVNQYKVSNLDSIRLRLLMNSRFEQLMKDLQRHDIYNTKLMDRQFYERLNAFCDEFFDGRRRSINLEMLIDSIHYEYKHEGAERFDKKSQSGGTTSTTTALILAVLLNQITPNHVEVRIPIVVDEIASLDGTNTTTTIDMVSAHGFTVFCATPKPEPAVMDAIGRWLTIGRFNVANPRVEECHTLLLPSLVESCGTIKEP